MFISQNGRWQLTRSAGAKRELRWQEKLVAEVGDRTPSSAETQKLEENITHICL